MESRPDVVVQPALGGGSLSCPEKCASARRAMCQLGIQIMQVADAKAACVHTSLMIETVGPAQGDDCLPQSV